jgi:hypothetical protein
MRQKDCQEKEGQEVEAVMFQMRANPIRRVCSVDCHDAAFVASDAVVCHLSDLTAQQLASSLSRAMH